MNAVAVNNIEGTYTLYNANGDVVGRVCTDTGKAMIGNFFYDRVNVCHNVTDDEEYGDMVFKCSKCGCKLFVKSEYRYDGYWVKPNMWVDGKASYPKCCPNCKSVIIEE